MDELIYVAMNGAKQIDRAQAIVSHNLANANTTGFRAELHGFQGVDVEGPGYETRVNTLVTPGGWSHAQGALVTTGNELDVAVSGSGWIAVQAPDGSEAYTRAGDLRVTALGVLTTGAGHPVLGDSGGPVAVPPHNKLSIGGDGTVSVIGKGQGAETIAAVTRLKLVDPPAEDLVRGEDGLMRMWDGSVAEADARVRLTSGVLESSNVNVVDALVSMIEISRQFEMQVRMMDTANENATAAASLMRMS
ncbi:MAG: flagellar basal-body rod protein FlgF [Pseudomonadales bacterium]